MKHGSMFFIKAHIIWRIALLYSFKHDDDKCFSPLRQDSRVLQFVEYQNHNHLYITSITCVYSLWDYSAQILVIICQFTVVHSWWIMFIWSLSIWISLRHIEPSFQCLCQFTAVHSLWIIIMLIWSLSIWISLCHIEPSFLCLCQLWVSVFFFS